MTKYGERRQKWGKTAIWRTNDDQKSCRLKIRINWNNQFYKHSDSLVFNEQSIKNLPMYIYLLTYLAYSMVCGYYFSYNNLADFDIQRASLCRWLKYFWT